MNSIFDDFLGSSAVRNSFVVLLAVLSLFLAVETIGGIANFGRSGAPATDTITVSGSGQVALPPDVARISFTVQNAAATVASAQDKTTEQANAAIAFVKEQGIDEKDVKTLSYTISPQYAYPNPCRSGTVCPLYYDSTPKITGYQVAESVQVTVHDLGKVGTLLEGLGKLSVQNVSGPDFALDDATAGYDAARADAIDKAKAQATLLAEQLGVRLGKIVNFSESSGYSRPMYGLGGGIMATKAEIAPDIPTGENTYTSSVSITYEIH